MRNRIFTLLSVFILLFCGCGQTASNVPSEAQNRQSGNDASSDGTVDLIDLLGASEKEIIKEFGANTGFCSYENAQVGIDPEKDNKALYIECSKPGYSAMGVAIGDKASVLEKLGEPLRIYYIVPTSQNDKTLSQTNYYYFPEQDVYVDVESSDVEGIKNLQVTQGDFDTRLKDITESGLVGEWVTADGELRFCFFDTGKLIMYNDKGKVGEGAFTSDCAFSVITGDDGVRMSSPFSKFAIANGRLIIEADVSLVQNSRGDIQTGPLKYELFAAERESAQAPPAQQDSGWDKMSTDKQIEVITKMLEEAYPTPEAYESKGIMSVMTKDNRDKPFNINFDEKSLKAIYSWTAYDYSSNRGGDTYALTADGGFYIVGTPDTQYAMEHKTGWTKLN